MAALIGQAFGRHPYKVLDMQKSWEGTTAMFVMSFVVSFWVLGAVYGWSWVLGAIALLTALFATLLESFSKLGIDNLTVPLGSAFLAYGLWIWWV